MTFPFELDERKLKKLFQNGVPLRQPKRRTCPRSNSECGFPDWKPPEILKQVDKCVIVVNVVITSRHSNLRSIVTLPNI